MLDVLPVDENLLELETVVDVLVDGPPGVWFGIGGRVTTLGLPLGSVMVNILLVGDWDS